LDSDGPTGGSGIGNDDAFELRLLFGRQRLGLGLFIPTSQTDPGVLKALQLPVGFGVSALHAALGTPEAVEQGDLVFRVGDLLEDMGLAHFHSGEFPLRDRHLLEIKAFGAATGAPFGFEIRAKLVEFQLVFAGQDDGAGAEAVTEEFRLDAAFPRGVLGPVDF